MLLLPSVFNTLSSDPEQWDRYRTTHSQAKPEVRQISLEHIYTLSQTHVRGCVCGKQHRLG